MHHDELTGALASPRAAKRAWLTHARKAVLIAVAAILLGGVAKAEDAPATLSVDEAVQAALRNNVSIKATSFAERAKRLEKDFSFNKLFPSVSVSATALRLNEVNPSLVAVSGGNGIYYTPDKANLSLGLTLQEVFNPAILVLMNQTVLDWHDSTIAREQAERKMEAAVKKAYYQIVVQDQVIALTRSRLEKTRERLRQAEVSYQVGQTSELNYSYARANAENVEPQLRDMETARSAAITQFQEILGFDARPDMALTGSLDVESVAADKWAGREMESLDVKKAQMLVKRTENGLRAQNALLMPNLILQYKADPTLNDPMGNSFTDSGNWRQSSGALSFTIAWDLTLFIPMSDYQVKRLELKDNLSLARLSAQDTMRKAADETENKRRAIEASKANVENFARSLESAKRAYELNEITYRAGSGRLLDLQDAELYSQQAEVTLLSEKLKLIALEFDWDAEFGADAAPKGQGQVAP